MSTAHPVPKRIVLATHNAGKLKEFSALLAHYNVEVISAGSFNLPEPEETGTTFIENSILKARAASLATNMVALADDSGLCVTGLNGNPGIFSARWAEPGKNFLAAMQRIQNELGATQDRSAYFICVLVLYWSDGHYESVEGRVNGTIAATPRGIHGHGYDPIFVPDGYQTTFAEMGEEKKNAISHRGQATTLLVEKFFSKLSVNSNL